MMNANVELDSQGRMLLTDAQLLEQVSGGGTEVKVEANKETIEAAGGAIADVIGAIGDAVSGVIDSIGGLFGGGGGGGLPKDYAEDQN